MACTTALALEHEAEVVWFWVGPHGECGVMPPWGASVIDGHAEDALRLGADTLEVEYKDGHEQVLTFEGSAVPY